METYTINNRAIKSFLGLFVLFLMLSIVVLLSNQDTFAITYSSSNNIEFSINPAINIAISSNEIAIPTLIPGSASESSPVTVSVESNVSYGYQLNATVGRANDYNTRDLILANTNAKFTSIEYGSAMVNLADNNTWGFSYKDDRVGSTWSLYDGLPLYSDAENITNLINTRDPAAHEAVQFKIAAKASNLQPTGVYQNVINFILVANPLVYTYQINYNDPSGESEDMPDTDYGLTSDNFVAISDVTPTREGYTFSHWCVDGINEAEGVCFDKSMVPGDEVLLDSYDFFINLVAFWIEDPEPDPCDVDPTDPSCQEPDPCDVDPTDPSCQEPDPCDVDPTDPSCQEPDPCDVDPTDPSCQEPDPCDVDPTDPSCQEPDPCDVDPTDPSCQEPDPCDVNPSDPGCNMSYIRIIHIDVVIS